MTKPQWSKKATPLVEKGATVVEGDLLNQASLWIDSEHVIQFPSHDVLSGGNA